MSERPTPEQIASTYKGGVKVLRRLEQYGYKIVHPDDVPPWNDVWNVWGEYIDGGDA